jgi:hypothetical protein
MQISWSSTIVELILGLLWYLTHLLISLFDLWSHLSNYLECYLISSELLPKYRNIHFERLKYVGIVVDRREANNILKIKQLLRWLSTIGVKHVVLYDIEGVIMNICHMLACLSTYGLFFSSHIGLYLPVHKTFFLFLNEMRLSACLWWWRKAEIKQVYWQYGITTLSAFKKKLFALQVFFCKSVPWKEQPS